MMKVIEIDVSELPPPMPMQKIVANLTLLPQKAYLKVYHRRLPVPLFPTLLENNWQYGYQSVSDKKNMEKHYFIYIFRKCDVNLFKQTMGNNTLQWQ
jgi:hypothetical protein